MSFTGRQPFLEFIVFDSRGGGCSDAYYQDCFDLWHQTWSETYDQLEGTTGGLPHCDAWFAATEIASIAIAGKPVAVCLLTWFPKALLESNMQRSSLGAFPGELVQKVDNDTNHDVFCLINGLAVSTRYRQAIRALRIRLSALLIALMLKYISVFRPSQIFVYTRNSKRINDIAYGHGFQALARNCIRHNVAVDFTTCDSDQLVEAPDSRLRYYAEDLFQQFLCRQELSPLRMSA